MKNFKQFMSESVNISGDFNGNLYINSSSEEPQQVGETYSADVTWRGSIYRLEMVTHTGVPTKQQLAEKLQGEYPGVIVHNIYPTEDKNIEIESAKRYQPTKLDWI